MVELHSGFFKHFFPFFFVGGVRGKGYLKKTLVNMLKNDLIDLKKLMIKIYIKLNEVYEHVLDANIEDKHHLVCVYVLLQFCFP